MDGLIPWGRLEARIAPFYPKAGRGRRPYPLGVMLRVHCVQLFYNLSDPGMEDLLYEVESVRRFAGLRLSGPLPDETTILHFRHLLEKHGLGERLFEEINAHLSSLGRRLKTGTIMDASIIDAPSSTKNRKGARDPEMRQTKKGNQWYFGMKAHIGVDADTGLTHSLETTAANGSDVATAHAVLHGGEERVWGDAGYQGVGKREENRVADVDWQVAMRPGKRRQLDKAGPEEAAERRKASVRAKVEHPFLYVKRHFGYAKVRYRGLAKNTQRIAVLLGVHQSAHRGARRHRLTWGSASATAARRRGRSARASKSSFPGTTTRPRWALAFHPRAKTPVYPKNRLVQTILRVNSALRLYSMAALGDTVSVLLPKTGAQRDETEYVTTSLHAFSYPRLGRPDYRRRTAR